MPRLEARTSPAADKAVNAAVLLDGMRGSVDSTTAAWHLVATSIHTLMSIVGNHKTQRADFAMLPRPFAAEAAPTVFDSVSIQSSVSAVKTAVSG